MCKLNEDGKQTFFTCHFFFLIFLRVLNVNKEIVLGINETDGNFRI
jgi:hypothetical protein